MLKEKVVKVVKILNNRELDNLGQDINIPKPNK